MKTVYLSENDCALAELIAAHRQERYGSGSGREFSQMSSHDIHRTGAYSEVGLATIIGQALDIRWGKADAGHDFYIPLKSGKTATIDVKGRVYKQGVDLPLFLRQSHAKADAFVLMYWHFDTNRVDCVGWQTRKVVHSYPEMTKWGPKYKVPTSVLRPIDELLGSFEPLGKRAVVEYKSQIESMQLW